MAKVKAKTYDASAIRQLKGLEAVRERPGMYLGDPTSGDALHHLIKEVVDNSVDEHLGGHCDKIEVKLQADGVCTVIDNGRGIPVEIHPEEGISALQMVLCSTPTSSPQVCGVGVSAVNAVSEWLVAWVWRGEKLNGDDVHYEFRCERGIPVTPVESIVLMGSSDDAPDGPTGTVITWKRDLTIFSGVTEYDAETICIRLQELAFLNPGLEITFTDNRNKKPVVVIYRYEAQA